MHKIVFYKQQNNKGRNRIIILSWEIKESLIVEENRPIGMSVWVIDLCDFVILASS